MNNCYICGSELSKAKRSKEHIIPNMIYGHLKNNKLLCNTCNNKLSLIDDILSPLNFCVNLLNSRKDRGVVPAIKGTLREEGMETPIVRTPTGAISGYQLDKKIVSGGIQYNLKMIASDAATRTSALTKFKQEFFSAAKGQGWPEEKIREEWKSIKRKIDEGGSEIEEGTKYGLDFTDEMLWSFLKIGVNFALHSNVAREILSDKISLLESCLSKRNGSRPPCAFWFYPVNFYPENTIHHTLVLISDRESRSLYVLISLFGVLNGMVLLSDAYEGKNIYASYQYDFRKDCEVEFTPEITSYLLQQQKIENMNQAKHEIEKKMNWFMSFFKYNDNIPHIMWEIWKFCMKKLHITYNDILKNYSKLKLHFINVAFDEKEIRILKYREIEECFDLIFEKALAQGGVLFLPIS